MLDTAKNCQLVLMSLEPKEEIGAEVHHLAQFFRVEVWKRKPPTSTSTAKRPNESSYSPSKHTKACSR